MPRNPQCSNSYRHLSAVGQVDPDGHGFSIHRISVFFTNLVRKTSPDSGFTLLELTVVLLILGILLALSIPRLGYLTGQNLSVTSRRISGTVRYLFHQSTLNRTIYRLNYDLKKNEYWVTYRDENLEFVEETSTLSRKVRLPRGVSFEDVVIVGKGKFKEGEVKTHFFPKGWVEETLVHLKDTSGRQTSIHILPLSATVQIHDKYVEPES